MTTIVNTPQPAAQENGGGVGMIIGLIVLLIMAYLFFVYGLPALRQMSPGTPQINVPGKIDVNVQQK